MKIFAVALLFLTPSLSPLRAQPAQPVFLGPAIRFLPPAVDATGRVIAFGSTVTPQGVVQDNTDLYIGSTKVASGVTSVGLTRDGSTAVFADMVGGAEGVGAVNISTGSVRRLNADTQGCVRPLALCIACFYACVVTPHATPDGSKVLYAVRRTKPFFVVNSDGTGLTQLPVYSGSLAPSPQRVIAANGRVVFTSSAPAGPTFAPSSTDVYTMNLDGTNIRNLTSFGNDSAIYTSNATISADGATVLFETNYAGAGSPPAQETQIWGVQSDGSQLRQLTSSPGSATNPSISADGKTGVYAQLGMLAILQPFDPQPNALRHLIAPFRFSVPQSPVISEDGQRVAFLIGPTEFAAGAVYQANTDGSGLRAVYAPRAISPRGVVGAAGSGLPPSPGGLISVYGINLSGDSITVAGGFPLPPMLGGDSLLMNGTRLPLLSVSPWQITAQLPSEAPIQSASFQVSFPDAASTPPETANIAAAAPALFGTIYQAAAFHAGTAILADDEHPARAGEVLEMYGTGLGVTNPPMAAGQPSPGNPPLSFTTPPLVRFGNMEARVLFAGLAPGLAGVGQVNIIVPDGLKPGKYGVLFHGDGMASSASGTISIQ